MSSHPEDCGVDSAYDLPWEEEEVKETCCPTCGSGLVSSSFHENLLDCENENCDTTVLVVEEY